MNISKVTFQLGPKKAQNSYTLYLDLLATEKMGASKK